MIVYFRLQERPGGFVVNVERGENMVEVSTCELVAWFDSAHLTQRLESFQQLLFRHIPGLPPPGQVENLLIVIRRDLSCTAYVNDLRRTALVKSARPVKAGDPVRVGDIADIRSVHIRADIPTDAAIVLVRSFGWKRTLFYDLAPIQPDGSPRDYDIDNVFARMELSLLGISSSETTAGGTRIEHMISGLEQLKRLLTSKDEAESAYQELLQKHPWMLGGYYSSVDRHTALDDKNIPDFTAVRAHDKFRDVVEIKQPFLKLFRNNGDFAAPFNDSWNQAEGYLTFVRRQRQYLRDKGLEFENPRCILLAGYGLPRSEVVKVRDKESFAGSVSILTYDHLLETAEHILQLARTSLEHVGPTGDSVR